MLTQMPAKYTDFTSRRIPVTEDRPNAETLAALDEADEIIRAHRARFAAYRNINGLGENR